MANNISFVFRRAAREDIKDVLEMIQELADFENMSTGPKLGEEDLIRDSGLDGGKEFCHIYVLELHQQSETSKPQIVGYAICFFSYSTWQGKSYFLEDIYVRPQYRKQGAGARLFREIVAKAKEYDCKRVDFHVLSWNPASEFYKHLGAVDMTEAEQWHFYRLQEQEIEKLSQELQ